MNFEMQWLLYVPKIQMQLVNWLCLWEMCRSGGDKAQQRCSKLGDRSLLELIWIYWYSNHVYLSVMCRSLVLAAMSCLYLQQQTVRRLKMITHTVCCLTILSQSNRFSLSLSLCFNGSFSKWTWVSWYQNVSFWILLELRMMENWRWWWLLEL